MPPTRTILVPPFDPAMMVCLLLYAYCIGVFSSRKIAKSCERNCFPGHRRPPAARFSHPQPFPQAPPPSLRRRLREVLFLAKAAGLVRLAKFAFDGTKVLANACDTRPWATAI